VGHKFRKLYGGGLVRDDAQDIELAIRELDVSPDLVVYLAPHIRRLDRGTPCYGARTMNM
jgi:hypothetical protein